jgi:hypothetical protein
VPNALEVGTTPFVTVSVSDPTEPPEHEPPLYIVKVTVPPAFEVAPVNVALSVTEPNTVMLVVESCVEIVGEDFCAVAIRISQAEDAPLLPVSPL